MFATTCSVYYLCGSESFAFGARSEPRRRSISIYNNTCAMTLSNICFFYRDRDKHNIYYAIRSTIVVTVTYWSLSTTIGSARAVQRE